MTSKSKKAIILLSGGLDSTTTLAIAKSMGYHPLALTFRYGQRHEIELEASKRVAEYYGIEEQVTIDINLQVFGRSALTADIEVPKNRTLEEVSTGIPITYVPARNTIFLSYGLAFAEVSDANDLFIGVNALDYSGYPDCRAEYITAYEKMANLATKVGVEGHNFTIHTPLIHLSKAQIIRKGIELGVDYGLTHSCYDPAPGGRACGTCDSCLLRKKGFEEAEIEDPIEYE